MYQEININMITAYSQTLKKKVRVNGLCNRGAWFGQTWLILVNNIFLVCEADNEQDAIDNLMDSKYGHLIATDEICDTCMKNDPDYWDTCTCIFAGSNYEPINFDLIQFIEPCKVNYFDKEIL